MTTSRLSIFTQYAKDLSLIDFKNPPPLIHHPQIPLIIDTLSRQKYHHLLIENCGPEGLQKNLIEALAHQLQATPVPPSLRQASVLYLDMIQFPLVKISSEQIKQNFADLLHEIHLKNKFIILAINQLVSFVSPDNNSSANCFSLELNSLLSEAHCRCIMLTSNYLVNPHYYETLFNIVPFTEPNERDLLSLLKYSLPELENFHQVVISDEALPFAISVANHYLSGSSCLEKAFRLLDSAAARVSTAHTPVGTPTVTSTHLAQVVSSWTNIPLANLQNNKFQASRFMEALKQTIFGQEAALRTVGSLLQNACLKLKRKSGPLCRFLLAGAAGTGKSTFAYAMAEYLFDHKEALLRVEAGPRPSTLADIFVVSGPQGGRCTSLLSAVAKMPYAIILIENIEKFSPEITNVLDDILIHGYAFDIRQKKYDFRNTIFIFTIALSLEYFNEMAKTSEEKHKPIDLMQLVLNHTLQEPPPPPAPANTQEIRHEIISVLKNHFSINLLEQVDIVPFIPLEQGALEKIVWVTLKFLAERLERSFKLELTYSAEIIKFLSQEILSQRNTTHGLSMHEVFEQRLFSCIAQEIIVYHQNSKIKSNRLSLKLNNTGNLLRCEFITAVETPIYQ